MPVAKVNLFLTGLENDTVITQKDGGYFFSSLTKGDYVVTPVLENFRFEPMAREYSQLQESQSDQNFLAMDIKEPMVTLLYPNGGQWLKQGSIDTIRWVATDNVGIDSVAIHLSLDSGNKWQLVAEIDSGAIAHYRWFIPDTVSKECLLKISVFDFDGNEGFDVSDSNFTIGKVAEVDQKIGTLIVPVDFEVEQNYPNPFNNSTVIPFFLPKNSYVKVEIFNLNGQKVRSLAAENFPSGFHRLSWDSTEDSGKKVSSGIYLYRIDALGQIAIKKFLYVR